MSILAPAARGPHQAEVVTGARGLCLLLAPVALWVLEVEVVHITYMRPPPPPRKVHTHAQFTQGVRIRNRRGECTDEVQREGESESATSEWDEWAEQARVRE